MDVTCLRISSLVTVDRPSRGDESVPVFTWKEGNDKLSTSLGCLLSVV